MLLAKRFHQNDQAVSAAVSINGLKCDSSLAIIVTVAFPGEVRNGLHVLQVRASETPPFRRLQN